MKMRSDENFHAKKRITFFKIHFLKEMEKDNVHIRLLLRETNT